MRAIDLNCDLGERAEALRDGTDVALMETVSSVSVACGGHAGDEATMEASVREARRLGVRIGAHPGYPDRARFGRGDVTMTTREIADAVRAQVAALGAIARAAGATVAYVKPHGALYHAAARDAAVAEAIARGASAWSRELRLVGFAGSVALSAWSSLGFTVEPEAFADRWYEADGSLRARRHPDALRSDPALAAEQAARIARGAGVEARGGSVVPLVAATICVHSDTPGAVAVARAVRARLEAERFRVAAP